MNKRVEIPEGWYRLQEGHAASAWKYLSTSHVVRIRRFGTRYTYGPPWTRALTFSSIDAKLRAQAYVWFSSPECPEEQREWLHKFMLVESMIGRESLAFGPYRLDDPLTELTARVMALGKALKDKGAIKFLDPYRETSQAHRRAKRGR